MKLVNRLALKGMVADRQRGGALVKGSDLDGTLVYASRLKDGPLAGYKLLPGKVPMTASITRADVAAALVAAVDDPAPFARSETWPATRESTDANDHWLAPPSRATSASAGRTYMIDTTTTTLGQVMERNVTEVFGEREIAVAASARPPSCTPTTAPSMTPTERASDGPPSPTGPRGSSTRALRTL